MKKGCEEGAFSSCKEACQYDGPCSKLFYTLILGGITSEHVFILDFSSIKLCNVTGL